MKGNKCLKSEYPDDPRVFDEIQRLKRVDTSFTTKGFFRLTPKYNQKTVREIWFQGIEIGMLEGLRIASLDGQRININSNMQNDRHKEFYDEFLKLADKYKCAIQYHPRIGMCVVDLDWKI
jgi:hypothetical protein